MRSVFIDSNIFIAFGNRKDRDHGRSVELLNEARENKFGRCYTSDYVFDECVTTALIRTRRVDLAVGVGKIILGSGEESVPRLARLIRVDEQTFDLAWKAFKGGARQNLSFTDHTIIVQMEQLGIDSIVSFDKGFDGVVARIS